MGRGRDRTHGEGSLNETDGLAVGLSTWERSRRGNLKTRCFIVYYTDPAAKSPNLILLNPHRTRTVSWTETVRTRLNDPQLCGTHPSRIPTPHSRLLQTICPPVLRNSLLVPRCLFPGRLAPISPPSPTLTPRGGGANGKRMIWNMSKFGSTLHASSSSSVAECVLPASSSGTSGSMAWTVRVWE